MNSPNVLKIINTVKQIDKLVQLNEYDSDQCLECLRKIDASFNEDKLNRVEISKTLIKYNYPDIGLKFLKHYANNGLFETEKTWPCAFYLLRSLWNYTDISSDLSFECASYIPFLLSFISNDTLAPNEDDEDEKLLKLCLNILNNLAHNNETKSTFHKYNAFKILKKCSHIQNEYLRVLVYSILAQIVLETEYDKLNDSLDIIESIVFYLKESLKKVDHRYKGLSTNEYLDCLAKLAVTKENKFKIYDSGVMSLFKLILNENYDSNEISNTLVCIWNLCFDEKLCEFFKKEKDLISNITELKNSSPYEDIQRRSAGILFTLNHLDKSTSTISNKPLKSNSNKHIMISYNSNSRDTCLKIKDELKSKGHQVWIDVEQIYGSSLSSMAEAVENASVFLMCITEKYYQSPNCRLEAEYAIRLQKPIIPLIMQADYLPLGWLGIILGSKIYYKFLSNDSDLKFNQTFSSMIKEINSYANEESQHKSEDNNTTSTLSKAVLWNCDDVKEWISSLGLSEWILTSNVFDNINGIMLKELYDIKKTAPDFYFNLIKLKLTNIDDNSLQLHDFLKFSQELTDLFSF